MADSKHILFFDGLCNSCNAIVNFIIARDRSDRFRFTPLQSETAAAILLPFSIDTTNLNTLVLISEGRVYTNSAGAFKVFSLLDWPWKIVAWLGFLPRPLTDFIYRTFAKSRYRLFGKRDICRRPTAEERSKFLP